MRCEEAFVACVLWSIGCSDPSFRLDVTARETAVLAAQDGDGPWQQLFPDVTGLARFEVTTGRYGLAYACSLDYVWVYWSTSQEPQTKLCGALTATVGGTSTFGASIFSGNGESVPVDASGYYSIRVDHGRHDVVALLPGSPTRFMIARDVPVPLSGGYADLPVDVEGVDMGSVTPIVNGATGGVVVHATLTTRNDDRINFGDDPTTVPIPPTNVRIADDSLTVSATSGNCTTQRRIGSQTPELDLPAAFSAEVDRTSARWTIDETIDWTEITWILIGTSGTSTSRTVAHHRSMSWIEAAGATDNELPILDVTSLPGWSPGAGTIADADSVQSSLNVSRGERGGDYDMCGVAGVI
jgi:hypothetical protein